VNKFERMKIEKDGLDVYPDLMRAAEKGWETLDDDDTARLKWYGLYPHNAKDGNFMLRVKVVQGILTGDQVDALASITEDYGRGIIDCTTRQCVQIHWIRLENIPDIYARLDAAGLTVLGACGDITRNVIGCTLAGIGHDQVVDGERTANELHEFFLGNKDYSNLPRKFKISVTGCREDCARGLINDLALSGAVHEDGTAGFNLRVGGGLSATPRFARALDVFVSPEEAVEVVAGVMRLFRDSEENRARRARARIKFLVDALGADGFRAALEAELGRELRRAAPAEPDMQGHDHVGVNPQHDGEHAAVGFVVPVGRLRSDQLRELGRLARDYGNEGELRLTHQQNVVVPWVPNERVAALMGEAINEELPSEPDLFVRGLQTCTGKEFCGLAKVHTKERAREIARFLDTHVRPNGHGEDLRVHFAGCTSSCAQQQIADVGIEGVLKKVEGEFIEAMDIRIGGRLGPDPRWGDVVIRKVPHYHLDETLLRIFTLYEQNHTEGETFRAFAGRTEPTWWTEQLETADALAEA
jgi:ferredoxin-nitrite reductase